MQLDQKDRKLVHLLSINCRTPLNELAKKLHVSKSTTNYRIKRLEKSRVIAGYQTLINHRNLGKIYGRVQISLNSISPKEKAQIISHLKTNKDVIWLATVQGAHDLAYVISSESVFDFRGKILEINKQIGKFARAQELSLATAIYYVTPQLITTEKSTPIKEEFNAEKKDIPRFDEKFLSILAQNANLSIIDLAQKCSCTTKTLLAHKRSLEKNQTILGYRATINPTVIGYDTYHIFWKLSNFDHGKLNQFREFLISRKNTLFVTEAISKADIESEMIVKSQREFYSNVQEIKDEFPGLISNIEFMLILEVHKS